MTTGVIALIVVLIVVIPLGAIWRRRQGQLRAPSARMTGLQAAPGTFAADETSASSGRGRLTAEDLRHDLGPRATLVQFSSAFCAPCRGTRQVLGDVAAVVDGVTYVEVDAESRLDLVRRLNVLSTPTVLVLGPDGTITKQATGLPRKPDVIAALGEVIAPATPQSTPQATGQSAAGAGGAGE
jgi:thiol-disulfide isomerase/thioredoxin